MSEVIGQALYMFPLHVGEMAMGEAVAVKLSAWVRPPKY